VKIVTSIVKLVLTYQETVKLVLETEKIHQLVHAQMVLIVLVSKYVQIVMIIVILVKEHQIIVKFVMTYMKIHHTVP
jgi:hypothetical protein